MRDEATQRRYEAAFARLAKSKFRSRFHLSAFEKSLVNKKGLSTIRAHCEGFIATRLVPAYPRGDGRQTPMRGHPVFVAQHACACCCRDCLSKWWKVPRGGGSRREATGNRRFPHVVDRAGDGGAEQLRHGNDNVEMKPRLILDRSYFTNICKTIFCAIDGKTANMI